MSVNVYKPHLLVLPEDGANRQMANGFLFDDRVIPRNIQVLQEAGGNDVELAHNAPERSRLMSRVSLFIFK